MAVWNCVYNLIHFTTCLSEVVQPAVSGSTVSQRGEVTVPDALGGLVSETFQ